MEIELRDLGSVRVWVSRNANAYFDVIPHGDEGRACLSIRGNGGSNLRPPMRSKP